MALDNTFAKEFEAIVKIIIDPGSETKQDQTVLFELDRQIAIEKAKAIGRTNISNGQIYYQAYLNVLPMIESNLHMVQLFSYLSAMMGEIKSEEERKARAMTFLKQIFGDNPNIKFG